CKSPPCWLRKVHHLLCRSLYILPNPRPDADRVFSVLQDPFLHQLFVPSACRALLDTHRQPPTSDSARLPDYNARVISESSANLVSGGKRPDCCAPRQILDSV